MPTTKTISVTDKYVPVIDRIQAHADKHFGGNWSMAIFELALKALKRNGVK
jgi:hypothetical protein